MLLKILSFILGIPLGKERQEKKKKERAEKPCRHQLWAEMQRQSPPQDSEQTTDAAEEPMQSDKPVTITTSPEQAEQAEQVEVDLSGECERCKKEKHDARVYRWKLIGGLLLPAFLASVDLTVVATALPFIASHFNRLDQLNWIVVAFTLTSTAFIPAFGQLADVFGRHSVLHLAVFLMLAGSVLCAAAQTWPMLLFGRALQGVSAAGINNLMEIILSDKVSLKDNAKNSTIFALVSGLSFSVGPIIGGFLTNVNWRYCFVISIPPSVIAHVAIYFLLRKELVGGTHSVKGSRRSSFIPGLATVDVGGTALFTIGTALIIIGTSWGGATYPWASAEVLAPLVIGSVLFVLFFVYEYSLAPGGIIARMLPQQTAMIPSDVFEKKDTIVLAVVEFATGAAMYSVFYFIGIYFALVEAYPASRSGVQLLFYLPGIGAGVYVAMFMCNIWPAQTWHPLSFGTFIEAIGMGMLALAVSTRKVPLINGMMALSGAGTGLRLMPAPLHAAGVFPDKIAPAMSVMRFALPFGGTLALTIMGSVFNNKMSTIFSNTEGTTHGFNPHSRQSLDLINDLPQFAQDYIRGTGKNAVMWAFISIMPIMAISVAVVLCLGNVWIKSKKAEEVSKSIQRRGTHDEEITSSEVIDHSYLWAICTGTVESKKYIVTPLSKAEKKRQAQGIFEEKSRIRAAQKKKGVKTPPDVESPPPQS